MMLEDKSYENWKRWAERETDALKQLQSSAYSVAESEEMEPKTEMGEVEGEEAEGEREVLADSVPGTKRGVEALGGAGVHP